MAGKIRDSRLPACCKGTARSVEDPVNLQLVDCVCGNQLWYTHGGWELFKAADSEDNET